MGDDGRPDWVDSGSGPGWNAPRMALPRLSKLRGILPAIPANPVPHRPDDGDVPPHVEVDTLRTILARHITGVDGICCCGDQVGEFTGRCTTGRRAAQRLTVLGFQGYDVPHPDDPDEGRSALPAAGH